MSDVTFQEAIGKLKNYVEEEGIRPALKYLNSLTGHRFTGLYLFDDPTIKNRHIIDAEDPDVETLPDVPVKATYCSFTRSKGESLSIANSQEDDRVKDHPARDEVLAYCGVPLQDERGNIFGTVCHFDYEPVDISDMNVQLLESIAAPISELQGKQQVA